MKAIIFAPATAGKTTIIRYLYANTDLPVLEMEDEFLRLHKRYPEDEQILLSLIRKIFEEILNRDSVVFFCNTDFLSDENIERARNRGFRIIQLHIDLKTMLARNKKRVAEEGYPDTSQWFEGMLMYQQKLRDAGLVDQIIPTNLPVEKIGQKIVEVVTGKPD